MITNISRIGLKPKVAQHLVRVKRDWKRDGERYRGIRKLKHRVNSSYKIEIYLRVDFINHAENKWLEAIHEETDSLPWILDCYQISSFSQRHLSWRHRYTVVQKFLRQREEFMDTAS